MDVINIECTARHQKPVRVIDFYRVSPSEPWEERPAASASSKREAAERLRGLREVEHASDGPQGFERWLDQAGPALDRPGRAIHLIAPAGEEWTVDPHKGALARAGQLTPEDRAASRDNYSIKCPRCGDGRDRRAEKLWPVLDAIISAAKPFAGVRSQSLSIPEFWLISDEFDRRVASGQGGRGALT